MLKLKIVSYDKGRVGYFGAVTSILCRTSWGYEEIFPGHVSFVSLLKTGILGVDTGYDVKFFALGDGIIKVNNDNVLVISEKSMTEEEVKQQENERLKSESKSFDESEKEWFSVIKEFRERIDSSI